MRGVLQAACCRLCAAGCVLQVVCCRLCAAGCRSLAVQPPWHWSESSTAVHLVCMHLLCMHLLSMHPTAAVPTAACCTHRHARSMLPLVAPACIAYADPGLSAACAGCSSAVWSLRCLSACGRCATWPTASCALPPALRHRRLWPCCRRPGSCLLITTAQRTQVSFAAGGCPGCWAAGRPQVLLQGPQCSMCSALCGARRCETLCGAWGGWQCV